MQQVTDTKAQALIGMSMEDLQDYVQGLGMQKFRAKQLFKWIYTKSVRDFEQMTDFSKDAREKLAVNLPIGSLKIKTKQVSSDGTIKYLFERANGTTVESVLMRMESYDTPEFLESSRGEIYNSFDQEANGMSFSGKDATADVANNEDSTVITPRAANGPLHKVSYTACISSQVGCAVGCPFCATGTLGFKENLSSGEIVEQILLMQHDTSVRVANIVFMGQGEPLNNYDEMIPAIHLFREAVGIGVRHITVSTSGVIPKIDALAQEGLQVTLALSLHDPTPEGRDFLVPINKKWPISDLMKSMHNYVHITNRRVTIEYVMLEGVNDSDEKAQLLGDLVKTLHCNINLIPYNTTDVNDPFQRPSQSRIKSFAKILNKASRNKTVTIRKERGHDIDAACGQLANK